MVKVKNGSSQFDINYSKENRELIVKLDEQQFNVKATNLIKEYVNFYFNNENGNAKVVYKLGDEVITFDSYVSDLPDQVSRINFALEILNVLNIEDTSTVKIPFVHPTNIMVENEQPIFIHFGYKNLLSPMESETTKLLDQIKALVVLVLNPKLSVDDFEGLSSNLIIGDNKTAKELSKLNSLKEIKQYLAHQKQSQRRFTANNSRLVSKTRYNILLFSSLASLLILITLVIVGNQLINSNNLQKAEIDAQSAYISGNYSTTMDSLKNYQTQALPKNIRYILASSSINLSNLTLNQKQTILNQISEKTDDNTLNYWVATGRSDFNSALNLALNLNDDQLILFAYDNLYDSTKLDTKMDGAKKQQLLDDYTKKINDLKAKLGI